VKKKKKNYGYVKKEENRSNEKYGNVKNRNISRQEIHMGKVDTRAAKESI
jgi:hypothetical protein